eukprot:5692699-Pleurochrysis_carterae.AAC.1
MRVRSLMRACVYVRVGAWASQCANSCVRECVRASSRVSDRMGATAGGIARRAGKTSDGTNGDNVAIREELSTKFGKDASCDQSTGPQAKESDAQANESDAQGN